MKATPVLLKIAYQLRQHCLGSWSLQRWGITVTLMAAAFLLFRWFVHGMPPIPFLHWAILVLILLAAGTLIYLASRGNRQNYVVFEPEPALTAPAGRPLAPTDKILAHVTAQFEVEGKSHFFADLLAYWRTFATREHAVMAIVHRSRFLLLGAIPERDLGMWYVFFKPDSLEAIAPGAVIFGATRRCGLRLAYREAPPSSGRGKPARPLSRIVYLGFKDESAREQVWADLLAD